jgi:hypothetical protein
MLYSFLSRNSRITNQKFLIYSLLFLLLSTFVLKYFDNPLHNDSSPNGIMSFEFAKKVSVSSEIIKTWKAQDVLVLAGLNTGFDFLYLLSYSLFISIVIYLLSIRWNNHVIHKIARLFMWLILFAAFFDIIENISLIKLLLGDHSQTWTSIAFYSASVKFSIVFICFAYIFLVGIFSFLKKPFNSN